MADDILRQGVQGITDLITVPGIVNLDFADVRTIMRDAGSALMGIGIGHGENRATEAAQTAVSSPLLESSIEGATGILLNITGPADLGLFEVNEAAEVVTSAADQNANVIFGAVIDDSQGDEVRVTVIATGFGGANRRRRLRAPGESATAEPRHDSSRPAICSTSRRSCATTDGGRARPSAGLRRPGSCARGRRGPRRGGRPRRRCCSGSGRRAARRGGRRSAQRDAVPVVGVPDADPRAASAWAAAAAVDAVEVEQEGRHAAAPSRAGRRAARPPAARRGSCSPSERS